MTNGVLKGSYGRRIETRRYEGDADGDKKLCVMYVGPHKTGSTTLQRNFFTEAESIDALKKDNYAVPLLDEAVSLFTDNTNGSIKFKVRLVFCFLNSNRGKWCKDDSIRRDVLCSIFPIIYTEGS